jgi:protein O-mannosyl-transferase
MISSSLSAASDVVPKNDRARKAAFCILAFVVLAVYLPAVFNNFVDWDDLTLIIQNPRFNHPTFASFGFYFTHSFQNLYMPVTCAVWAGLGKIGSINNSDALGAHINPYVFHLASLLLHTIASLAVLGILCRTTKMVWPSLAGAILFALHPLQVEAVAFVGAMNTVLAGALSLLAIWLYLKSADRGNGSRRWFSATYVAATVLFALAMLSKPTAIVAPAIAFLLDWITGRRSFRAAVISALPWIMLAIPCAIWTQQLQHGAPAAASQPLWTRPIIAGDSSAFYLGKLIWPMRLAIDYGQTPAVRLRASYTWLLAPIILLVLLVVFRRGIPLVATGIVLFFIALLPNSGLITFDYQQFSTTADRYVYLSMLGVALVFAGCVARMNWRAALGISIVVISGCVMLTEFQIRNWRDGETLFRHAIEVNPDSWMSRSNLANVIMDRSPDEAITQCQLAVQVQPDFTPAWGNLGSALEIKGDRVAAVQAFARAYQLDPITPPFAANYARSLADTGDYPESARIYRQILNRDPESADAKAGLDRVSSKQ